MDKKYELGIITIGQSPRPDMTGDLEGLWGDVFTLVEEGALDQLSSEEISRLIPQGEPGEEVLVTRLRDGSVVQVTEGKIRPLVQRAIDRLEHSGVTHILLLCTGDFGQLRCSGVLWKSSQLLKEAVISRARGMGSGHIAVVIPDEKQRQEMEQRWLDAGVRPEIQVLSPYAPDYNQLKFSPHVSLILLDCMGYSQEVEERVSQLQGKPACRARRVIAEAIAKQFA